MANIKVHLLNFHSIFTHIEIVLEDTSTSPSTYYGINRWETPAAAWLPLQNWNSAGNYIRQASSTYHFMIEADPTEISKCWREYWFSTENSASILGNNCGVAAQWFLRTFADIPDPSLSNISHNLLILGLMWPSFIPCPITLPGRIMANAKFHIEARRNPKLAQEYSRTMQYFTLSLTALTFSASAYALTIALPLIMTTIGAAVVALSITTGFVSAYNFFGAYNTLTAIQIADDIELGLVKPLELGG